MTKREALQARRDMEGARRAFDALRPSEMDAIVNALHAEEIEKIVNSVHRGWNNLVEHFQGNLAGSAVTIAKWREGRLIRSLPENLHNDLEWADTLFEAAATAHVSHDVLTALQNLGPDKTRNWIIERLSYSVGPGSSSSTSHNLVQAFRAKALARALDALRWML